MSPSNARRISLAAGAILILGASLALAVEKKPAAPPKISDLRLTEKPGPALRVSGPGDRISLDIKDADIRDVLRTFATLGRVNMVIDPEVRGSVTMRLDDVRWTDALEVMLRSNGLASETEGAVVRVGTPARLTADPRP